VAATVAPSVNAPDAGEPDGDVRLAFALGWLMADAYRRASAKPQLEPDSKKPLPGLSDLKEGTRTEMRLTEIGALLHRLSARFNDAGVQAPTLDAVNDAYANKKPADIRDALYRTHVATLGGLLAADRALGKAYNLARALADTGIADTPETLKKNWATFRVGELQEWLNELATAFPAHSARAVSLTMDSWRDWVARNDAKVTWDAQHDPIRPRLGRQARLWRSLLTGEKSGVDMLLPDDYISAADGLMQQSRSLARKVARRFREIVLLAMALFVLGVVLALASTDTARILAGIGAVASALGLTWKSVGSGITTLGKHLQGPLWGAQLDAVIAKAILRLPWEIDAEPDRTPPSGPAETRLEKPLDQSEASAQGGQAA
jgi:hypothetical protein